MASTYSPLLRIELIGTGDQANTWGVTTNTNLGTLIEQAIAGFANIVLTDTNFTLSEVDGGSDQSRCMFLLVTGNQTASRTILAPNLSKMYVVKNGTSGGLAINVQGYNGVSTVGNSVSIPNGKSALVYFDGNDFGNVVQSLKNVVIDGVTLTGLNAPIAVVDGGTGATIPATARSNLGAAASGINSDITGFTGIVTPIAVVQGGTGASSASAARANLEAAKSGGNTDITSLNGITTPLTLSQGGTGANITAGAGKLAYSTGSALALSAVGTAGQYLVSAGTSAPTWQSQIGSITYVIDGGGVIYSAGVKGFLQIPFNCTITAVSLLADQTGSTVIDIWKDTYANFPPTVADSITGAAKPTITATNKSVNSTLTGWTTTITAGDVLAFNVDSVTSITRVTITLSVNRT